MGGVLSSQEQLKVVEMICLLLKRIIVIDYGTILEVIVVHDLFIIYVSSCDDLLISVFPSNRSPVLDLLSRSKKLSSNNNQGLSQDVDCINLAIILISPTIANNLSSP